MTELLIFLAVTLITPFLVLATVVINAIDKRRKKTVVFVCEDNAGRSQMSQAHMSEKFGIYFNVMSAGTKPLRTTYPMVRELMKHAGLHHRLTKPRKLDQRMLENAIIVLEYHDPHLLIALKDKMDKADLIDWSCIEDPKNKKLEEVEAIFKKICQKIDYELVPFLLDKQHTSTSMRI